jgi:hypothetical protein
MKSDVLKYNALGERISNSFVWKHKVEVMMALSLILGYTYLEMNFLNPVQATSPDTPKIPVGPGAPQNTGELPVISVPNYPYVRQEGYPPTFKGNAITDSGKIDLIPNTITGPEAPEIKKLIYKRDRPIDSNLIATINNNSRPQEKLGMILESGSVVGIPVIPESIFIGTDDKIYFTGIISEYGSSLTFQVNSIRTFSGGRFAPVDPSQYGKLSDFGMKTAGIAIRAPRPSEGWTMQEVENYLLLKNKKILNSDMLLTLEK